MPTPPLSAQSKIADAKTADAKTADAKSPTAETEWQISERGGGSRGGEVAVSLTAEPRTFQPLLAFDEATQTVLQRIHAGLVRQDGESFEIQPALATSWTVSKDHRQLTLELRRGVRFSDGEAFDADDVVFSLRAAQDPETGSAQADAFVLDGEPVAVKRLGSHRVRLSFPAPHPSPVWLLNDFPILPEHRLGEALREGRLAESWPLGTAPHELAGLGPFRLSSHEAGRRIVLERNPHYWRRDAAAPGGTQLPYLDRLIFDVVGDENAKVLRFRSGESHLLARLPGDRFAELKKLGRGGAPLVVRDLGPGLGLTFVIFNLNDVELPEVKSRQRWFRHGDFRRALARAVDRRAIADIVYHGHATPVVSDLSPGNRRYWDEGLAAAGRGMERADLEAAAKLLQTAGFEKGEDGLWADELGRPVDFTLVTNTSNQKRSKMGILLQEDFRRLGLRARFVGLEFSALVERLTQTFDYDLLILEFGGRDLDPSAALNIWRVDGGNHFFHLGADEAAFAWEAEIDRLMRRQAREIDPETRRKQFLEVQEILAREAPFLFLVAPNVLVGAHRDLGNFAPSILDHTTLWNSDELFWKSTPGVDARAGAR